jgi:acyl-CoA synthetase (AMP-forming)/AMP-acid ligase II
LRVDEVCFVGNGTLPLTTSGKLRRAEVRERWERGEYTIQSEGMEHDVQTV